MALEVAAIGLGGLANVELDVLEAMPGVHVAAGADVSEDARELFESEYDVPAYAEYRTMLDDRGDDLDAALVVSPHTLHYEQVMACLERDLHVLVEKPMVTDVRDAVSVVDAVDERGVVLEVGYQRHFHPGFQEVRRIVESGRIGALHNVSCHLGQDWITPHRGTWRVDPSLSGGGQLYDSGSHLLDALLWTTDGEPRSVSAEIDHVEPGVDVNSALAVRLGGGDETLTASVSVSGDGATVDPKEGYVFWGTDGRLTYSDGRLTVREKEGVTYEATVESGTDFHTLTRKKLGRFVAVVRGEATGRVPPEYGLQVTALTEAAYEAAETACAVDVQARIDEARVAEE